MGSPSNTTVVRNPNVRMSVFLPLRKVIWSIKRCITVLLRDLFDIRHDLLSVSRLVSV